jgi:putative transposase
VKDLVPEPEETFHYLEFDIKYIYIHGLRKNAMLLTVIDVDSRLNLAQMLQMSIKKEDVVALFTYIKQNFTLPQKVTVRSDNGSQFVAQLLRSQLIEMKINQEFTKPATPEQNAHIESYHSIVERTICQKYQFGSLKEANETFDRFQKFYNHERVHSGVGYTSPMKYLKAKGFTISNPDFTFTTT